MVSDRLFTSPLKSLSFPPMHPKAGWNSKSNSSMHHGTSESYMNRFHPVDNADTKVEDGSETSATTSASRHAADAPSQSLSVEVLNKRLHDQQFYTRSLIESNIDALMTTDTKGVITDVNQQMVDLTGRTRDELIGAPCRNFFTNPARADTAIARVLAEDRISDYELTVRSFDGTETVVSYNAATLRDRERTVRGVFAAARDVTESKRFERALLEKNFKLEQSTIARADYVRRAKVDLLTPLHAAVEAADALRRGVDGDLTAAQQVRVETICAHSEQVLSLLGELIGMSRMQTGLVEFDFQDVNVHSLLQSAAAVVNQTGERTLAVSVDVADDVAMFPLDAAKVEQILAVLLSNAVVASPNGAVTVHARLVDRSVVGEFDGPRPQWAFPLPGGDFTEFLEIRVVDHGIGIAAADLPAVFVPPRHGEIGTGWKPGGNGLGLAMVKLLVEVQDGTLGVESTLGDGATFAVWLPRRTVAATSIAGAVVPAATAASPEGSASSTREAAESGPERPVERENVARDEILQHAPQDVISEAAQDSRVDLQALGEAMAGRAEPGGKSTALVVEDDDKSAKLVRLLLEAEGFQVVVAPSGEAALELARRIPLSLITLDVQLPGMDGWKFLLKLHDSPELASIPVVVIAGLADMSMALSRGAAAVLEKPLQRAELQNSLTLLELRPDQARCILVVDEDRETVEQVTSYLEQPAYRVESAATGDAAITDALTLTPDLILINLMREELGGFKIVRALQEHATTQHIPVLVMSSVQLTNEEQDIIDSDPEQPVIAMNTPDFNREALLAEIKRALD